MSNKILNHHRKMNMGGKAEKDTCERFGGRMTPASGATGIKGDFTFGDKMVEVKSTVNETLPLKKEWLHKLRRESTEVNKEPVLAVAFIDSKTNKITPDGNWVLIPEDDYLALVEEAS